MSAVDEYRKFTFGVSQNTDAGRVTKKADVAIAALEAELAQTTDTLTESVMKEQNRAAAAEAHNKTLASEYGHMTEMFKQSQAEVARLRVQTTEYRRSSAMCRKPDGSWRE